MRWSARSPDIRHSQPRDWARGHCARSSRGSRPVLRGGLLIEGNYSLDSRAFHLAIAAAARGAGVEPVRASATGVAARGGLVTQVHTAAGSHPCDALVLATGPWVAETRE